MSRVPWNSGQPPTQLSEVLRRRLPYIARRDAQRRDLAYAQRYERFFGRPDPADNASTQLPIGEQARIPAIWLAELFTPTSLPSLIGGVRELTSRQGGRLPRADADDPAEWIISARRRGGGGWRHLPSILPAGSQLSSDDVVGQVPAGIAGIGLTLYALTSTVTVLIAKFVLEDDRVQRLEGILNQKFATQAKILPNGRCAIFRVKSQKAAAIEEWRTSLRQEAADWLAKLFPGSFHRLAPGQLPAIELLLTGQYEPGELDATSGTPGWARMLDLGPSHRYWQCTAIPRLRLQQRGDIGLQTSQRHRFVLVGPEQEFKADVLNGMPADDHNLPNAIYALELLSLIELLAKWSLTTLIRELEDQLAALQDVADQASRKRSPRALADTQQQLLQTGIDSRIVVNDIIRYAQDPRWKHGLVDYTEVVPPSRPENERPTPSLCESLRQGQITDGQRVSQLETDLREILSTTAELTSASENLRLQRRVVWLTAIALLVAIVAAAAAVIALTNSGGPTTTPRTPASNSSAHAAFGTSDQSWRPAEYRSLCPSARVLLTELTLPDPRMAPDIGPSGFSQGLPEGRRQAPLTGSGRLKQ